MSIERKVEEIKHVKRHEGFILDKPFTLLPNATVATAKEQAKKYKVDSFIIVDEKDKVIGILTRRDVLFVEETITPVKDLMTPFSKLIYAKPRVTVEGMPLKKFPPLAGACGWRTMIRLVLAARARVQSARPVGQRRCASG